MSVSSIATEGGALTITPVTVGTSATILTAATDSPRSLLIINNSTQVVDIGPAGVTVGAGIPLQPSGGSFELEVDPAAAAVSRGAWYGVSPSGGADVRVIERS